VQVRHIVTKMDLWLAEKEKLEIKKAEVEIEMQHHVNKLNFRDVESLVSYMYNCSPVTIGTDIIKAKRLHKFVDHIDKQITIIAKRMYREKHGHLPMRIQEFSNGVDSWVDSYAKRDMPILEAAHDEFMIDLRRAIDMMMDERRATEKTFDAEKRIKRAREEMELEEKEIKRRKHGPRM
jgi:hypothetical protein